MVAKERRSIYNAAVGPSRLAVPGKGRALDELRESGLANITRTASVNSVMHNRNTSLPDQLPRATELLGSAHLSQDAVQLLLDEVVDLILSSGNTEDLRRSVLGSLIVDLSTSVPAMEATTGRPAAELERRLRRLGQIGVVHQYDVEDQQSPRYRLLASDERRHTVPTANETAAELLPYEPGTIEDCISDMDWDLVVADGDDCAQLIGPLVVWTSTSIDQHLVRAYRHAEFSGAGSSKSEAVGVMAKGMKNYLDLELDLTRRNLKPNPELQASFDFARLAIGAVSND